MCENTVFGNDLFCVIQKYPLIQLHGSICVMALNSITVLIASWMRIPIPQLLLLSPHSPSRLDHSLQLTALQAQFRTVAFPSPCLLTYLYTFLFLIRSRGRASFYASGAGLYDAATHQVVYREEG